MFVRLHKEDAGYALLLTIGIASVLSILLTTVFAVTIREQRSARTDRDHQGALAAANAAIDDYLYRINRDSDYWIYHTNEGSTPNPDPDNPAFSGWVDVPGEMSSPQPQFRYVEVDTSRLASTGNIFLTTAGRVHDEVRVVHAQLRRLNFLNYLYFTEYETLSPLVYPEGGSGLTRATAEVVCRRHLYDSPARDSRCTQIYWATGDSVDGPFHTNDLWAVDGNPRFLGAATGSSPSPLYVTNGVSNPQYQQGFPRYAPRLTMPPSNQSIKIEADPALGGEGCLFSGPTSLVFRDGVVDVRSPQTLSSGPGCGSWPSDGTQTISIPENGVIYVQNSPASQARPNTCGTSSGRSNGLGYPYYSWPLEAKTDDIRYDCFSGDAFVEGVVDGRVTVAAENNIAITWHLTRKDRSATSDDIIGLVANNFIQIYHPVSGLGTQMNAGPNHPSSYFSNPQVDAAILSVRASFIVPNWDEGAPTSQLGHIHVNGAIAQIFRGPVGLVGGSAGYLKDYVYDQRLTYQSPPHFIDPVEGQWGIVVWTECRDAETACG